MSEGGSKESQKLEGKKLIRWPVSLLANVYIFYQIRRQLSGCLSVLLLAGFAGKSRLNIVLKVIVY